MKTCENCGAEIPPYTVPLCTPCGRTFAAAADVALMDAVIAGRVTPVMDEANETVSAPAA